MENVVNPRRSRCIYLVVWILWGLAPGKPGGRPSRADSRPLNHIASFERGIFAHDETPDH